MLTAGSRDLFGVSLMGNAPLGEALQGRLSLAHRQERGYVYNVARDVWLGGVRMWGGRLQLRYTGWDATTVDFTADYVRDRQNALLNRALGGPGAAEPSGVREASFDASPIRERDLGGLALTIEHRLASGGSLVSITAFRASDSLFARNDLDLSSLDLASNQFADEDEAYGQELRFVSLAGDRFDYVVGLFFYHQTPKSDWVTRFGPAFPVPALHGQTVTSRADVESTTAAAYGHGTWRLTDRLSLEGGLRLNHVTLNNLLPGAFETGRLELQARALGIEPDVMRANILGQIPAGRLGTPDELGRICAFLCSAHAGYLTRHNLLLDGGAHPGLL